MEIQTSSHKEPLGSRLPFIGYCFLASLVLATFVMVAVSLNMQASPTQTTTTTVTNGNTAQLNQILQQLNMTTQPTTTTAQLNQILQQLNSTTQTSTTAQLNQIQQLLNLTKTALDKNLALEPEYNPSQPLGLPGHPSMTWNDVLISAQGQTVNYWMWAGEPLHNAWVDTWLAPRVKSKYLVTVSRALPAGNQIDEDPAYTAVGQTAQERSQGNNNNGLCDLVWTNGNNFAVMKAAGNWYGPWTEKIPNANVFNFLDPVNAYDFQVPIDGFELPYTNAQFVFAYNPVCGPAPVINSMADLVTWVKNNPGRFTYPQAGSGSLGADADFTGSAFIRHFLYEFCGPIPANCDYRQYNGPFNQTVYNANVKYALAQLRAIQPYLYGCINKTSCSYPVTQDDVDLLFGNGSICIVSTYSPLHPGQMAHLGAWPANTSIFLPTNPGTIANTNFLGIAYNAKNLFGALVVANEMASYAAQFSRRDPNGWAAGETYDPSSSQVAASGWDAAFAFIDAQSYAPAPTKTQLQAVAIPELDSAYQTRFQIDWQNCIAGGSIAAPCM